MKNARNIFLAVFVISTLAGCVLFAGSFARSSFLAMPLEEATSPPYDPDAPDGEPSNAGEPVIPAPSSPSTSSGGWALFTSILTSVVSFVGFLTTTIITWRKEKRESDLAAMERKKLELELEKSKLELEELKRKNRP